jgi:Phage portal protein, SPP1 Gp6-like.
MTIDEVLAIEDKSKRINLLKKGRRTPRPDVAKLYADWNPSKHEIITDTVKYPKVKVTVEKGKPVHNPATGKTVETSDKVEFKDPNRISIPLEQDIVNIQTAFTVGTEPSIECDPVDEGEESLLTALKQVLRKNKIKYQNKKIVRSWLSEQEVAEYWYSVKDDGFWSILKRKVAAIFGKSIPEYRLRSVVWSPFKGDKLYPFFDDSGDMVAFSREYEREDLEGVKTTVFMTLTKDFIYTIDTGKDDNESKIKHGFPKLPVIYTYRKNVYCDIIRPIRIRIEKLLSGYGDCIDSHFFPILKLFGDVTGFSGSTRNRVVQLQGEGADAAYLTWQQAADPIKLELETLFSRAYSMTNTPQISFENLKGAGNALSGSAFRYVFMGAHMAVENHAEEIGLFMQRRVNFIISALGAQCSTLSAPAKTIDVDVEIVPYMIDSLDDKVQTAVAAIDGGIWSRREGIMFAGNRERVLEELEEIEEDKQKESGRSQQIGMAGFSL